MIYTVTLNPSLDYIMHLNSMELNAVNRSIKEEIYPGGKGINVSIVLSHLGLANKALGFIAGFTGNKIQCILEELGIGCDFITLPNGLSRINVKLEADTETEINGIGPEITRTNLTDLIRKLDMVEDNDFLVLAGSIPKSVPDHIYEDILRSLSHKQINIIVDATKDLLLNVLKYKPFLIKPNHIELAELFGVTIHSDDEIIAYARKLQEMGAQNVLISKGGKGSILITYSGDVMKISAPKGEVINTVGSGDSMVAGFIAGYIRNGNLTESLKFATAAGSATAFSPWLTTKDKVQELLTQL